MYFIDFLHTSCYKIYKFSTGFGKNHVLEVERWLDPAFYWKQLLIRTILYILLRMRSSFHQWWKYIFSTCVQESHLKSWLFKKISFQLSFHFVYEFGFWIWSIRHSRTPPPNRLGVSNSVCMTDNIQYGCSRTLVLRLKPYCLAEEPVFLPKYCIVAYVHVCQETEIKLG